jgi:hypothetical protein
MVAPPPSSEVDLYMACIGNTKPPQFPMKEALISLGVETILPGTDVDPPSEHGDAASDKSPTGVYDFGNEHSEFEGSRRSNYTRDNCSPDLLLADALDFGARLGCDNTQQNQQQRSDEEVPRFLSYPTKKRGKDGRNEHNADRDAGAGTNSVNTQECLGYTQQDANALVEECSMSVLELCKDMSTLFKTSLDDVNNKGYGGGDGSDRAPKGRTTKEQLLRGLLCQNPEDLNSKSSQVYLFLKCADSTEDLEDISFILHRYPHLARTPDHSKRLPLHVATSRTLRMPKPKSMEEYRQPNVLRNILADAMNQHVLRLKSVVDVVFTAHPLASTAVDISGSLPLHHLAKQFWQLEVIWTEEMQIHFSETHRFPRRPYISYYPLFDEGTKMVDRLLQPIVESPTRGLLKASGGNGCLLPLHIAAIYGVPYKTMQQLLDRYPDSAYIPSKKALLGINGGLALELFESRRTGKPKKNAAQSHKKSEEPELPTGSSFDRTSDLIFAYNPHVLPFRKNQDRLQRIEHRIVQDAMRKDMETLTKPAKMLWMWMCTFQNEDDEDDHYEASVDAILNELDVEATERLLAVKGPKGSNLVEAAATPCALLLRNAKRAAMRRELDSTLTSEVDTIAIGALCRSVFGVTEEEIPTNFMILPYKVMLKEDNTVTLASRDDVDIAMDFAKALAEVNRPEGVSQAIAGMPAPAPTQDDCATVEGTSTISSLGTWSEFHSLLDTYESGLGYLYFLDEKGGTPMISGPEKDGTDSIYPIEVEMSSTHVLNLLPLMQMGATLMRGKLGVSILGQIILDHTTANSPHAWFDAARSVLSLLKDFQEEEYVDIQDQLTDLLIAHQPKTAKVMTMAKEDAATPPISSTKWEMPIRMLKDIVDLHDPKSTFAGLAKRQSRRATSFAWTNGNEPDLDLVEDLPSKSTANEVKAIANRVATASSPAEPTLDEVWSLATSKESEEKSQPMDSEESSDVMNDVAKAAATAAIANEVVRHARKDGSTSRVGSLKSNLRYTSAAVSSQDPVDSKPAALTAAASAFPKQDSPPRRDHSAAPTESKALSQYAVGRSVRKYDTSSKAKSNQDTSSSVQKSKPEEEHRASRSGLSREQVNHFEEDKSRHASLRSLSPPAVPNQRSPSREQVNHSEENKSRQASLRLRSLSPPAAPNQRSNGVEEKEEGDYKEATNNSRRKSTSAKKDKVETYKESHKNVENLRSSIDEADQEEQQLREEVEALQAHLRTATFRRRRSSAAPLAQGRYSIKKSKQEDIPKRGRSKSNTLKKIVKQVHRLEQEESALLKEKAELETRAGRSKSKQGSKKKKSTTSPITLKHDGSKANGRRRGKDARFAELQSRIDILEQELREQQAIAMLRNE